MAIFARLDGSMNRSEHPFTNKLVHETSPYLLQHAHNPVNWFAWGPEALEKAKAEDKPILLSIGYSACHWCHVMEHESFENEQIAAVMNKLFVNIKVDREERPDLDHIYMQAVQHMTGQGGWPLNAFLTPQGIPFYGGTYFPPESRYGRPGFGQVLESVAAAYRDKKGDLVNQGKGLIEEMGQFLKAEPSQQVFTRPVLDHIAQQIVKQIDPYHGGFGNAPKFPQAMTLMYLCRYIHRTGDETARHHLGLSLDKMAMGGMYDQVGGGFCRYSTDAEWLVPHFEKMLYDNALLSRLYLEAWMLTGNGSYRAICVDILDYVLREMTSPEGAFYSTQDADSEGVEGKFFVWSKEEFDKVIGPDDAPLASEYFDITDHGNWEHSNIPNLHKLPAQFAADKGLDPVRFAAKVLQWRSKLFTVREKRVKPGRDEKILTAWNGMMMASFAMAGRLLGENKFTAAAKANAEFLLKHSRHGNNRLHRNFKDGRATLNGYLEDYALVMDGLVELYQATFEEEWIVEAVKFARVTDEQFADKEKGGYFFTSEDHETLIQRPKELDDNATPCGNSVVAVVYQKLALLAGDPHLGFSADRSLKLVRELVSRSPTFFGNWLCAAEFFASKPREIALVGTKEGIAGFEDVLKGKFAPFAVVAAKTSADKSRLPLLGDKEFFEGKAVAYVCEQFACLEPLVSKEKFAESLTQV